MIEALRVAVVLISGIYAGAVVIYLIILPRLFDLIPGEHAVRVKRYIDPFNDRLWPPFIVAAMVLSVVLLAIDRTSPLVTALTVIGLVGLIAVPVTTRKLVIPVNHRIHALDADSTDPSALDAVNEAFRDLHRQWAAKHALRMACALTAFVCFSVALGLI